MQAFVVEEKRALVITKKVMTNSNVLAGVSDAKCVVNGFKLKKALSAEANGISVQIESPVCNAKNKMSDSVIAWRGESSKETKSLIAKGARTMRF